MVSSPGSMYMVIQLMVFAFYSRPITSSSVPHSFFAILSGLGQPDSHLQLYGPMSFKAAKNDVAMIWQDYCHTFPPGYNLVNSVNSRTNDPDPQLPLTERADVELFV